MLHVVAVLVVMMQTGPVAAPPGVKVAEERVVLNTPAGLIVIALYPEVAPQNVRQVMTLVSQGVYDGTGIVRIVPNFVMQLSAAEMERTPALNELQRKLITNLPLEASKLKHVRGVVSMAHDDKVKGSPPNDSSHLNSARTSFSILLGDAPHLDGEFTIIGHVEYGMDVVEELIKAPVQQTRPRDPLLVQNAQLVLGTEIHAKPPPPAREIFRPAAPVELDPKMIMRASTERMVLFSVGVLFMIICSLIPVFVPKITPTQTKTMGLMTVLIGAFLLVAILQPLAYNLFQSDEMPKLGHGLAIFLFFGLLGVFRLMSRFESAA